MTTMDPTILMSVNALLLGLVLFFVQRLVKKTDMLHEKVIKLDTISDIINIKSINELREEIGILKRNQDTLFRYFDEIRRCVKSEK